MYATVAQLRGYLHQLPPDTSTDTLLADILERATDVVDGELGFAFGDYGAAAARDIHSDGAGLWLQVPSYEAGSIEAVLSVHGRGEAHEAATDVLGCVPDESLRPYRLWRGVGWRPGWYRVTARWGYGPPPKSIEQVTLEVGVNIWRSRDAGTFTDALGVTGDGSIVTHRSLTWAQRSIIERVRQEYLGVITA